LVSVFATPSFSLADVVARQNWIPSGSYAFAAQEQLGDMWTFSCPAGGSVTASVDTLDDNDNATSNLDPAFWIYDGDGTIVQNQADDEITCAVAPECGFDCPSVTDLPCGAKNPHSISIVSAAFTCVGGGAYRLSIEVKDANGVSLLAKKVKLGGGDKKKLPGFLDPNKEFKNGPALDDEKVPVNAPVPLLQRSGSSGSNKR
jgi:hypothetical protein